MLNGNVWAGGCIAGLTRVTLSRQTEVDSFPINYSGCTMVYGDLIVSGNNITNLNGLSALTHIYGMLSIQDNPLLLNLNGLNRIDSAENLTIENNTSLITLNGLNNLTYAYYLSILDNPLLINLNGLNSLKSVNGSFDIRGK
ncbi:MAG: hypothetical protein IPL21_14150 [Saprospirales bacterium]|nr:hypothetical protein [Saprospirales bacterium]